MINKYDDPCLMLQVLCVSVREALCICTDSIVRKFLQTTGLRLSNL
jgi:hypothetical protein